MSTTIWLKINNLTQKYISPKNPMPKLEIQLMKISEDYSMIVIEARKNKKYLALVIPT
jgi:hypothetical protein